MRQERTPNTHTTLLTRRLALQIFPAIETKITLLNLKLFWSMQREACQWNVLLPFLVTCIKVSSCRNFHFIVPPFPPTWSGSPRKWTQERPVTIIAFIITCCFVIIWHLLCKFDYRCKTAILYSMEESIEKRVMYVRRQIYAITLQFYGHNDAECRLD
jgi:hypothetical protein